MTQPFVFLAIPSFRGQPEREFVRSLSQTKNALSEAGINYAECLLAGDPYLAKARDRIAADFLTNWPMATDFFFLDDDIGWPAHKVVEFVQRPQDVVVGVYPKKQDALEFPVTLELDAEDNFICDGDLYLAHLAPTGFMRIKRPVLEKLAMASPRYYETSATGERLLLWSIFHARFVDLQMNALAKTDLDALAHDEAIAHLKRALGVTAGQDLGQFWGEDYWFTERWRDLGGKIWVDPEIEFTHRGSKAWGANFGHSVRATIARQKEAA